MSSIDNLGENEFKDEESNIIGKSEDNEDEEIADKIKDEIKKEDRNIINQKENQDSAGSQFSFEITSEELKEKLNKKTGKPIMIFDIGNKERYQKEHIPGSKFAVCDQQTMNSLLPKLPKNIDIVLVAENEDYTKQMAQIAREKGGLRTRYLKGGISSWNDEKTENQDLKISAKDLKNAIDKDKVKLGNIFMLDVRSPDEFKQWSIEGSKNIPLDQISNLLYDIPKEKEIVTICPHGNRAGMATFMLQRQGYNVKTLEEGLNGWSSAVEHSSKEYKIANGQKVKVVQVRKIGKGCISYIVSLIDNNTNINDDEAIVIDPVFPIDEYIRIANAEIGNGAKITKVFDTHLHADHVSAARELADKIDAQLYVSSYEDYSQDRYYQKQGQKHFISLKEGDISTGEKIDGKPLEIKVIHTPGHTSGGICLLICGKLLFTGDTLFVDGVGRPDLRDKAEEFASLLYNTLHNKIFNMQNKQDIIVFPGHTDKIIDEEEILSEDLDNIQKKLVILNLDRKDFVRKISSIIMPTPSQYKEIILMNKGDKKLPPLQELQELEMGPNRCSISI
jgi:glyoxylase-like metal-dependent hydrolase (beta-lactamase superfamily II)/rhodanese-related sulfurtransferase